VGEASCIHVELEWIGTEVQGIEMAINSHVMIAAREEVAHVHGKTVWGYNDLQLTGRGSERGWVERG
jgi:hypothetical protein